MDFARICARLDPRCFKAFQAVVTEGSFSAAAPRAAMTVSGVSQHIASLEEAVGTVLFLRTTNGCRLTDQGLRFHKFIETYGHLLADLFEDLDAGRNELQGLVRYAMPPSCILSPHFPMLLERRLAHPDLELSVSLVANPEIFKLLQAGEIDFGFVTEFVQHPNFSYKAFCQEEYILVSSPVLNHRTDTIERLIGGRFVIYPGFDAYFNCFVRHFFPGSSSVDARSIANIAGRINTIDGGIKMVAGGLGISVFPRHCVQHLVDAGVLVEHRYSSTLLLNQIYILQQANSSLPRRVSAVIDWFMDMSHA